MNPRRSGYRYNSFNKAWIQVLRRLKPCSRRVGDSRCWGSLTMVPAGNKAKRLWSVNHTTKIIHHSSSSSLVNRALCPTWLKLKLIKADPHPLSSQDINTVNKGLTIKPKAKVLCYTQSKSQWKKDIRG